MVCGVLLLVAVCEARIAPLRAFGRTKSVPSAENFLSLRNYTSAVGSLQSLATQHSEETRVVSWWQSNKYVFLNSPLFSRDE